MEIGTEWNERRKWINEKMNKWMERGSEWNFLGKQQTIFYYDVWIFFLFWIEKNLKQNNFLKTWKLCKKTLICLLECSEHHYKQ
jgi:hypothetical protein